MVGDFLLIVFVYVVVPAVVVELLNDPLARNVPDREDENDA
jgi:hypothetical protein